MTAMPQITRPRSLRGPRRMSITEALHWAFATEKAQLDFDRDGAHEYARCAVDTVWIIAQQGALGCRIDGGGAGAVAANTATDAQIIAAAVEQIPEANGGRRMSLIVAECARAGIAPDWGQGDRLACVPSWDFDAKQGGWVAFTERSDCVWRWTGSRGAEYQHRGKVCPVSYTGSARSIAAKRRAYLDWYGALLHLYAALQPALIDVTLTGEMPDMAPWRAGGC